MKKTLLLVLATLFLFSYGFSINDARLLRFPDIHDDTVAFVYAGDIWTVPTNGGEATRLTSHEGWELYPKISPDGKWIAFTAEYSNNRQIYVMPITGGTPKQLTYYNDAGVMDLPPRGGYDHIPLDWTNDSKKILIRANRTPFGERAGKYYLVDLEGGLEEALQIPEGGFGSFSPDGKKIVYAPIAREFRTWKRYKGGRAADVWIYDLEKDTSERITTFAGTDHLPLWYKDKLYFVSDQEGSTTDIKLNIWSYDLKSKKMAQVTTHGEFDVMWPSGHNGWVAYENGGYLYKLNLDSGRTEKITVNLHFDNPNMLPRIENVKRFVSEFGAVISPTGKRAVFDARGDIFTVPAKEGITYNLTRTQGVREMYPAWSPDGKWIAYISDTTGDYEIFLLNPNGKKAPVQLTQNHKVWKYPPLWSPDSKKLLIYDANRSLQVLDIQTKKITLIDKASANDIDDADWSSDSNWIVYSKNGSNRLSNIWVYSVVNNKTHRLTTGEYDDFSPIFSKDGKYIYFVSNRDFDMSFNQGFSSMEFDFVYNRTARIFSIALTADAPPLFKEGNDRENGGEAGTPGKNSKPQKKKSKPATKDTGGLEIDFEGIGNRIVVFPLPTGRYNLARDLGGKVLYREGPGLYLFDMKRKKSDLVMRGIGGGDISADGKKLLYSSGGKFGIVDIKPNQKVGSGLLKLDGLTMKIDPAKEWPQIYNEAWRIFRDWFYVRNMHGVDWQKMKERYAQLLPYVSHRADLDYILGELVSELNAGHSYVNYGDFKRVKRIDTGLLGAEFSADKKAGRYIIANIFEGENWNERTRSPLTEYGVDIKEGDYLISLNGYDVTTGDNPYKFLENTVGKRIEIVVNSKPTREGARTYLVKPIKSEYELRTLNWVISRRKMVDKLSNGRIGYIFVPDTAVDGNRELFKSLYAYNDKEAFIIDDRYNKGGWSPGKMIEKIAHNPISYWYRRDLEMRPEPLYTLEGPKVMLINNMSSSGGDNFPFWFKKRNLGPLIGTRTWGGLVGYSWTPSVVDGPNYAVPMSGIVSTDGEFIVEGVGVYPDEGFEVYDRPEEVARGKDPSIEKAVEYLLEQLKKKPVKKTKKPAAPNRSRWFEKEIK